MPITNSFISVSSGGEYNSYSKLIPNISFNVDVGEDDLTVTGAIIVGGIITYIIANDLTGFGMADNLALIVLIPLFVFLGGEL